MEAEAEGVPLLLHVEGEHEQQLARAWRQDVLAGEKGVVRGCSKGAMRGCNEGQGVCESQGV